MNPISNTENPDLNSDARVDHQNQPRSRARCSRRLCCLRKTVDQLRMEKNHLRQQVQRQEAILSELEHEMSVIRRQQVQAEYGWRMVKQELVTLAREVEGLIEENNELKNASTNVKHDN